MLVLTRKKDQALVIGDDIEITVLDIQGDQIRLGVDAPKSIKIFRKELYLEILEENKSAAKAAAQVPAMELKSLLNIPDAQQPAQAAKMQAAHPVAAPASAKQADGSQPAPDPAKQADGSLSATAPVMQADVFSSATDPAKLTDGSQPAPAAVPKIESV